VDKNRRAIIEIHADLHQKIRKLAILNDLKIYVLANAIIEDVLSDQEKTAALIKRLKLQTKRHLSSVVRLHKLFLKF
jgi:hypothetical protein